MTLESYSTEYIEQLVEVATLYYINDLTQQSIANELGMTRQRVNKLLKEALNHGIVQTKIVNPMLSSKGLRERLIARYGLKDAEISLLSNPELPHFATELGRAGVDAVVRNLADKHVIGLGWGNAVYQVTKMMEYQNHQPGNFRVIPLTGGFGEVSPQFQINWITTQFAEKVGGKAYQLHAPYLVEHHTIKEALLSDKILSQTTEYWSKLDMAIVGIGTSIQNSPLLQSPYFSKQHMLEIQKQRIKADICSRYFDAEGRLCDWDINQRLISITLEEIQLCPTVVAVAGGPRKLAAIKAALTGNYIDVLVTDYITAESLCNM